VTADLVKELDELLALVEAKIPANPNSRKNIELAKELEGEVKSYFGSVEQALPMGALGWLYLKHVKAD